MFETKFTTQTDLKLFKTLQKHGRLSHGKLAAQMNLPKTTVQYAHNRLKKRGFYEIKAVPILDQFPELPLAVIGFTELHPVRLNMLLKSYGKMDGVRAIFSSDEKVLFFLMMESKDKLAELAFEIMEKAQAKPAIQMLSPSVNKWDTGIPDSVLDALYGKKSRIVTTHKGQKQ